MLYAVATSYVALLWISSGVLVRYVRPADSAAASAGAMAFTVALLVLWLFALPCALSTLPLKGGATRSGGSSQSLLLVVGGSTLQEVARLIAVVLFRSRLSRLPSATWLGFGFAGAELMFFAVNTLAAAVAISAALIPVEVVPEHVRNAGGISLFIVIIERIGALSLSMASSYFAVAAVALRKPAFFLVACGLHAVVNSLALFVPLDDTGAVFLTVSAVAAIGTWTAAKLHKDVAWLR